ncbi:hypothetical protein ABZ465_32160 [Streptomyces griseoincarnatus]
MRIAVTGSIATEHLAAVPGGFGDQLIPDQFRGADAAAGIAPAPDRTTAGRVPAPDGGA